MYVVTLLFVAAAPGRVFRGMLDQSGQQIKQSFRFTNLYNRSTRALNHYTLLLLPVVTFIISGSSMTLLYYSTNFRSKVTLSHVCCTHTFVFMSK